MTEGDSQGETGGRPASVPFDRPDSRLEERVRLLSEVIGAFANATIDFDELLAVIARKLAEAVGDLCSVLLASPDLATLTMVATHDTDPTVLALALEAFTDQPFAIVPVQQRVLETGEAFIAPHITPERTRGITTNKRATFTESIGMHSVLLVALRARGQPLGVLNLVRHRPERPGYDEQDRALAQQLADHAAVAIANARLLREHNDDLRNAKEAAEAANRELQLANGAARAANRELEAFASAVAHDLRAPLRTIEGFSAMLETDHGAQLDQEAHQLLQRVRSAAKRMAQLIDDLLRLSRFATSPIDRQPVDVSALARSILSELETRAPGRSVHVHVAERLVADADPRLLRIVLENLLGNAWKFTSKQAEASIVVEREDRADETVFVVRDDGVGFDPAYAGKLFGPFQRLHPETDFEGTGIGLATVQRIIVRHGGRVWAESRPGQGAAFRFTLR